MAAKDLTMQDEIRRRILERDKELQEARQLTDQTEATLEALAELTDVSGAEMRAIAAEVETDYLERQKRQLELESGDHLWMRLFFTGVLTFLLAYLIISAIL